MSLRRVADGSEDTTCDHIAFDTREPDLDLVEPRRIGWCEVEFHVRVLFEETRDFMRLMRRKVIEDHVDFLLGLAQPNYLAQEIHNSSLV